MVKVETWMCGRGASVSAVLLLSFPASFSGCSHCWPRAGSGVSQSGFEDTLVLGSPSSVGKTAPPDCIVVFCYHNWLQTQAGVPQQTRLAVAVHIVMIGSPKFGEK